MSRIQNYTGKRDAGTDRPIPGVVHLPRGIQTAGRWGCGCCMGMAVLFVWIAPWFGLFWAVLAVCFSVLCLAYRNWCVLYDDRGFETVDLLGRSRYHGYEALQGIGGDWLYLQGRKLRMRKWAVGRMAFLETAHRHHRALHNNRPIPLVSRRRLDPFRGNVCNPERYLLVHLCIFLAILAGFLSAFLILIPESEENTISMELVFTDYKVEKDRLLLTARGIKLPLVLKNSQDAVGNLLNHCDGESLFCAHVVRAKSGRGPRTLSYDIRSLTGSDGTPYYTFQQSNAVERTICGKLLTMMGGIALVWLLFFVAVLDIGRHPQKYKAKTVYRFFRKNTIIWKGCFKDGKN